MSAAETAAGLTAFAARGAGTDAERRAAHWLARQVRASRRQVRLETFWCRPNWALAHAWHCLLATVGSLLMVAHATLGGAIVLVALLSVLADGFTGRSLGRRLTPERASQNVVSPAPAHRPGTPAAGPPPVRLIVTANYDAGRTGLAYRDALRRPVAALKRWAAQGALTPGWLGWISIELLWLLGVAALRAGGASGAPVGVLQLVPTAALVVELAILLELAGAPFGPSAGDNASGAGVALALVRALDAAPPRRIAVELVLQGAADGSMTGLRRHLRNRRRELTPSGTVVLGIGPCGSGSPCWWVSDGPLIPLRYLARSARAGHAPRLRRSDRAADPGARHLPRAPGPRSRPSGADPRRDRPPRPGPALASAHRPPGGAGARSARCRAPVRAAARRRARFRALPVHYR